MNQIVVSVAILGAGRTLLLSGAVNLALRRLIRRQEMWALTTSSAMTLLLVLYLVIIDGGTSTLLWFDGAYLLLLALLAYCGTEIVP